MNELKQHQTIMFNDEGYNLCKCLNIGLYQCGWFGGWIQIEKEKSEFITTWCSGKTSHDSLCGSAISVDFGKNYIGLVCKSIISMQPVYDETKRIDCVKFIIHKLRKAIKKESKKGFFWKIKKMPITNKKEKL